MFRYFWVAEELLPPGLGFGMFSVAHCAWLAALALGIFGMCQGYRALGSAGRSRMRLILAFSLPAAEAARDVVIAAQGVFYPDYWPLHLCGVAMFLYLGYALWPNTFCGEVLYSLCLPGAAAALLFPNWAGITPLLQFQCIYSFLYHGLLVGGILMLLTAGELRPKPGGLKYPLLFLLAAVPPLYWINLKLGTNFFFLNLPAPGSPLEPMAKAFGSPGYLAPYGVLAAAVVSLFYLPLWVRSARRRRAAQKIG
ncbi:YwaF family protein [Allofournierella sp.]|uniref:YwaF family protein n=1 Tax=Allofournierella sp. TaxID=1940256 RepID=UPI003AB6679D